jgi:organic radical activating enzyme
VDLHPFHRRETPELEEILQPVLDRGLERSIPVSEIFYSIQGEGVNAGVPAVFLRTFLCNLTCEWCDTTYTWIKQDEATDGINYNSFTQKEIIAEIKKYNSKHLVITGGEPLIHQTELGPILEALKDDSFFIEVETNASIIPSPDLLRLVDQFNASPKLSNSGITLGSRLRSDCLNILAASKKTWFKFVLCKEEDLEELEEVITRFDLPRDRVMLMAEGTDHETLIQRSRWIIDSCKRNGFRYSPRLQILLFGDKRRT